MPESIRIFIAGEHRIPLEGLRMLLEAQDDFSVVGAAWDDEEALRLVHEFKPDILLLDLATPSLAKSKMLELPGDSSSTVRTLLLVPAIERDDVIKALDFGVRGIVLKESPPELLFKSIRSVMAGQHWVGSYTISDLVRTLIRLQKGPLATQPCFGLTRREREVIALIVAGYANRDLAEQLGISEDTVKHHLTNIFDRTGASNRLELALFAIHHEIVRNE
jgi:two-component system, NarL family, nitrate/nitrite response regulator NarL